MNSKYEEVVNRAMQSQKTRKDDDNINELILFISSAAIKSKRRTKHENEMKENARKKNETPKKPKRLVGAFGVGDVQLEVECFTTDRR